VRLLIDVNWAAQRICLTEPPGEANLRWTLHYEDFTVEGDDGMAVTLTDVQKVTVGVQPVDAKDNPAAIDGVPVWAVSDPALLSLAPNPSDPNGMVVLAVGPLGNAQVSVTVDADLGAGVLTLTGLLDVTVVSSQATTVGIVVGTPENQ